MEGEVGQNKDRVVGGGVPYIWHGMENTDGRSTGTASKRFQVQVKLRDQGPHRLNRFYDGGARMR